MEDRKNPFVPCGGSTGAPELLPIGEIIENREKGLKVYYVDPGQIKMLEEFYGLNNGRKSDLARLAWVLKKDKTGGFAGRARGGKKRGR